MQVREWVRRLLSLWQRKVLKFYWWLVILNRLCKNFMSLNDGAKVVYHGESAPVVFNKILTWLFTSRRIKVSDELRSLTFSRQKCLCAICGDELGSRFEMDHISPLCTGGSNEASNYRALCPMCHAEETDKLLLAGMELNDKTKFHTIESHMSPQLREMLHCAPKPKEVTFGTLKASTLKSAVGRAKPDEDVVRRKRLKLEVNLRKTHKRFVKTRHIADLLKKHPMPRETKPKLDVPAGISTIHCLDAKSCRVYALTKRTRGLPVFSPLDDWEAFELAKLPGYDFVFIDLEAHAEEEHAQRMFAFLAELEEYPAELEETKAVRAQILKDLEYEDGDDVDEDLLPPLPEEPVEPIKPQAQIHEGLFPYTGARWYAAEVCDYLLEKELIPQGACRAALRATRHVPGHLLATYFEALDDACDSCIDSFRNVEQLLAFKKTGRLAVIGMWNSTDQHAFKQVHSNYQIDAGNGVTHRRKLEDGTFMWTSSVELVDLYSMAPWGRIALDAEQLRIAQALASLRRYPDDIRIVGAHVDGVFFLSHGWNGPKIYDEILEEHKFADGTPMFHLKKDEPISKVPTWKQPDPLRAQKLEFSKHRWTRYNEDAIEGNVAEFVAKLVQERRGLLLTGPAGTGKSTLVGNFMPLLKDVFKAKQLAMALRHCTAMLVCGKTIQHYLCKWRRNSPAPGTILIIDEFSEVQLHTWIELARLKLVGVIFILVGDADGQRKPMFDRWQDAMNAHDIRDSRLLWDLCGGVRVHLTTYRRGEDEKLFKDYCALYKIADRNELMPNVVQHGRIKYPLGDVAMCDHFFVITHRQRLKLNYLLNHHFAQQQTEVRFIPSIGEMKGVAMQPQAMIIWKGLELLCYSRKYTKNSPVTGAVYVVESWDSTKVTVTLHPDYEGKKITADAPANADPEACENEDSEEEEEKEEDADALAPEAPEKTNDKREGTKYVLTFHRVSEILRLQHALVYAGVQGRTFREKHVGLMDLERVEFLGVRDMIVAMSRPTHGKFLHFLTEQEEAGFMRMCRDVNGDSLRTLAAKIRAKAAAA